LRLKLRAHSLNYQLNQNKNLEIRPDGEVIDIGELNMKRLDIKNWNTSDRIINWSYYKDLRIAMSKADTGRFGGGYQYVFVDKDNAPKLTINIGRIPNANGRYSIRGKSASGKYSNIYSLSYQFISNAAHVRYTFNEIINQLC
jgi:hypothetical protein